MKKISIFVLFCVLLASVAFSAEKPELNFYAGNSFGLGSFFDPHVSPSNLYGGYTSHNHLGIGFQLSGFIPVTASNRLAVLPDLTLQYGHQDFVNYTLPNASPTRYNFSQFGAGLSLAYSLMKPANGWNLYALSGLVARHISGDDVWFFAKKNYLGCQGGLGVRFRPGGHWGISSQVVYQAFFSSQGISGLVVRSGISYQL